MTTADWDDTPEEPAWYRQERHEAWEALGPGAEPDDGDELNASLAKPTAYKAPTADDPDDDGNTHTSWWPIRLRTLFEHGYEPQRPELFARSDGQPLLYPGKCHACNGEGESGKSWFLLIACLLTIKAGQHVLYIDFEDTEDTVVSRLLALGADPDEVIALFHYMAPNEPTFTLTPRNEVRYTPAHADLWAVLERHTIALVVIDGVTEAMGTHGLDPEKNGEFRLFHDTLTRPIARSGPACAYIDHVTKDKESRGKYAIGGVHKYNAMDGAVFSFQPLTTFGVGQHGSSRINVQKDRPGQLRQHTPDGKHVADLHLISDPTSHKLTWKMRAPDDTATKFRPTHYMQELYGWIEDQNERGIHPNARQIDDSGLGAAKYLRQARALLVAEGYVTTTEGPRMSLLHRAAKPYRETTDPLSDKYIASAGEVA